MGNDIHGKAHVFSVVEPVFYFFLVDEIYIEVNSYA